MYTYTHDTNAPDLTAAVRMDSNHQAVHPSLSVLSARAGRQRHHGVDQD